MSTQSSTVINLGTAPQQPVRSKSLWEKALYRIRQDRLTMIALTILVVMTLLAIFAPVISSSIFGVNHYTVNARNTYQPIGTPGHVLGTDELGRDHMARLLYAGRVSLGIGFSAAVLSLAIGIILGMLTGYFGGWFDDFMIWFITTLNSIPGIPLLLIINALLSPSPVTLVFVLAILGWTGTMRLVRGETFALREREFVVAARALGASSLRIMFIHILPNIISLVIITLAISIGALILTESALSYLGFGISTSEAPSWGNMLSGGLELVRSTSSRHLVIFPGLMIATTVLCLYIIGDGLRDAFDPKLSD
jgi:peptide/nickel transport system permease protein